MAGAERGRAGFGEPIGYEVAGPDGGARAGEGVGDRTAEAVRRSGDEDSTPGEAVRRGFATQQAFDDLIRGYYRFAEGSINMVAPSLLILALVQRRARPERLVGGFKGA